MPLAAHCRFLRRAAPVAKVNARNIRARTGSPRAGSTRNSRMLVQNPRAMAVNRPGRVSRALAQTSALQTGGLSRFSMPATADFWARAICASISSQRESSAARLP